MQIITTKWAAALTVVLALGILVSGSADAQQKLTPVRAAYVPVGTWLPAWVAKDQGIFEKNGLDVTLTPIQNSIAVAGNGGSPV